MHNVFEVRVQRGGQLLEDNEGTKKVESIPAKCNNGFLNVLKQVLGCNTMSSEGEPNSKTIINKEPESRWDELKRARNRINSQRTRERERQQIETLEAEKSRLWLSNDAIKYQNQHLREAIFKIREIQAQPSLRQNIRGVTDPASQIQIPSLRGGQRQPLVLEGGAQAGLPPVGVPQNLASLMMSNDGSSQGFLNSHPALGLQPMMRRTLGGVHPLLLNPSPLPAATLFQGDRQHQLVPLPDTDISLFGAGTGIAQMGQMGQMGQMPNTDAAANFNAVDAGSTENYYSERKMDAVDARLENLRKRQRTNNFM